MTFELVGFSAIGVFTLLSLATVLGLFIGKVVLRRRSRDQERFRRLFGGALVGTDRGRLVQLCRTSGIQLLRAYSWVSESIRLSEEAEQLVREAFEAAGTDLMLMRQLHDRRQVRRMRAATYLAYLPTDRAGRALNLALAQERRSSVKLRIVFALVHHRRASAIPTIIDSLSGSSREYQQRARALLLEMGEELEDVLPVMAERREPEVQRIFVELGTLYPTKELQDYLERLVAEATPEVSHAAFQVLATHFTHAIDLSSFLESADPFERRLAIESLGKVASERSIDRLMPYMGMPETQQSAVTALSEIVRRTPRFFTKVIALFRETTDPVTEKGLAEVIAPRSEYVVNTALRERWSDADRLVGLVLRTRRATGVLSLLNRNADAELERRICELMAPAIKGDPWLREEYGIYAKDSVVKNLGIERREIRSEHGERQRENASGLALLGMIFALVLAPAAGYAAWWLLTGGTFGWELGGGYLRAFEHAFAVYAFALNSIYLALLVVAALAVTREHTRRELRPLQLLFRPGILPSVSIIVPAHNEEQTIAQSVNGLLNLRYSDYEVIVVNDGSSDATLETVVERFQLERADHFLPNLLNTRPIRGVYRNPRIPGLVVIDKSNGGKADSLNAGINASKKEYFAAIDCDSLLEQDSLLHLAADSLDGDLPVVATGGNVLPVNGCDVSEGQIEAVRAPRKLLPGFQMIEYIRAFMTGRTAWARMGTLLIISGAFGLFRKRDVVDAGGYLTSSERYTKDTVAEDMELVVRVTRHLRERGEGYRVQYAANANCWTEVPSTTRIFASQRDRWQRGLIDILLYHVRMLFNPRYGRVGMLGFPYYYIFELFGPWIEIQGYLFFIAGLVTGVLPTGIILLVLGTSLGLGILNSVVALQLAEWRQGLFSPLDRVRMLSLAILENLGYRQYANLLRVRGYVSALRRRTGWGTMRRRGFTRQ